MLDVFFTVDVEIWCDGWTDIDRKFPDAYRRYILGPTRDGDYGLPFQLKLLQDHGIKGTFFVEPLFSTRFGSKPLGDIVGRILENNQEIQLHLHPEWVDESRVPLLKDSSRKRQHLFQYSLDEQTHLIRLGLDLLERAGATGINAFRAGSFGFNRDTLRALAANHVQFDSSYNATQFGPSSGIESAGEINGPLISEGVIEYPMTVFKDGFGSLRHAQLTACTFNEMESLLWQALEAERTSFIILSHNFELLCPSKNALDKVMLKRFRQLCEFLQRNDGSFRATGFQGLTPKLEPSQKSQLRSSFLMSSARILEQAYRRKYR